jgi:hypothetical protein
MRNLKVLRLGSIAAIFFTAFLTSSAGTRQMQQQGAPVVTPFPAVPAQEFVSRTIQNELQAAKSDDTHYMYKDKRQTPDGSRTKLLIETPQGVVAYLIAVNDRPLTSEQQAQENQRIQTLLSNVSLQLRKKKEQQADADRVLKMFRELPRAFNYEYQGVVPGRNGHDSVELKFWPNPNYDPPSHEAAVFRAMNGTMVIDRQAERLVKIQAQLFKDVNFGWGILGHLNQGGHFLVEQTDIGGGRWEATYMDIQFTGKALLFKSINLRQLEWTSDFVRVPDNLTLSQAVEMLRKQGGSAVAQVADNGE